MQCFCTGISLLIFLILIYCNDIAIIMQYMVFVWIILCAFAFIKYRNKVFGDGRYLTIQISFNSFFPRSNQYRVSVSLDELNNVDFVCVGWGGLQQQMSYLVVTSYLSHILVFLWLCNTATEDYPNGNFPERGLGVTRGEGGAWGTTLLPCDRGTNGFLGHQRFRLYTSDKQTVM